MAPLRDDLLTRDVVREHPEVWTKTDVRDGIDELLAAITSIWLVPAGHLGANEAVVERA
jgi:hypothetical protein